MNELLDLHPRQWNLIISSSRERLLTAITYLAHTVPLNVLDCGRQFDPTIVARAARGRQEVIDRIHTQRAFTCHEAVKLLEQLPGMDKPVIVIDFLSTFYDENVKLNTRKYLLETALHHFQRLSYGAGLAVSAYLPRVSGETDYLFERLQSSASRVLLYEVKSKPVTQLSFI